MLIACDTCQHTHLLEPGGTLSPFGLVLGSLVKKPTLKKVPYAVVTGLPSSVNPKQWGLPNLGSLL